MVVVVGAFLVVFRKSIWFQYTSSNSSIGLEHGFLCRRYAESGPRTKSYTSLKKVYTTSFIFNVLNI